MTDSWAKNQEAVKLTRMAEIGTPEQLKGVHEHLIKDMHSNDMTPDKYASLLKDMQDCNKADRAQNPHLPSLELTDSTNRGVPDSVTPHYDDLAGSINPTQGADQSPHESGAELIRRAAAATAESPAATDHTAAPPSSESTTPPPHS